MIKNFDDVKKVTEENAKKATEVTKVVTSGVQAIASEAAAYSKSALEAGSAAVQDLSNAKSLDAVVKVYGDHGKKAYEDAVAYTTKITDLYANLAKQAFEPYKDLFPAAVANAPVVKSASKAA